MAKLFDFAIGNPPYQASKKESDGNKEYAAPVYNYFLDEACKVSKKVEFIHPARFLFNAGSTPKAWNRKMLNDNHYKILDYQSDAKQIFPNTDIKGGVAISYYDRNADFGPIGVFVEHAELNRIMKKVKDTTGEYINKIALSRTCYRLTDKLHNDHPEAISQLSDGHAYDMSTNIFERLPQVFFDNPPADGHEYAVILGRQNNERVYKFIQRDYINDVKNFDFYKVVLAKANGVGKYGEILSSLSIEKPGTGSTETYLSIGQFPSKEEAEACLLYIKTKFFRSLLGILKRTQDITPEKFAYVPLQDFSSTSDIDWSKSIAQTDQQLYKKYGLSDEEIQFIESHVKGME